MLVPSYVFSLQELTLTLVLPPLLTPKSQCKHLMEQPEVLSLVNDISMCSGATSTTVGVLLGFLDSLEESTVILSPANRCLWRIPTGDQVNKNGILLSFLCTLLI